jgi:hypothetical protein
MALIGINSAETRDYVSPKDPDKDNPTVFSVGVLDPYVQSYIEEMTNKISVRSKNPDERASINYSDLKRNILIVRLGVKDIRNFIDPQTQKPIRFDTVSMPLGGKNFPAITESIISMMSKELINELAGEVETDNNLSEEEEKN